MTVEQQVRLLIGDLMVNNLILQSQVQEAAAKAKEKDAPTDVAKDH
jgi:hypothetical protein